MFGKTLENKNTCLYNKTMNIEIKNSNYTNLNEKLNSGFGPNARVNSI